MLSNEIQFILNHELIRKEIVSTTHMIQSMFSFDVNSVYIKRQIHD